MGVKQKVCPQCGEPVPEGATICMVCGQSLGKRYMMQRELAVVAVFAVLAIVVAFFMYPLFFGPTSVTSTGNVRFVVTISDGSLSVEYDGTADGRDVAELQIAILSEGGISSEMFSFADPRPGTVLGPVETGALGNPIGVYYVAVYDDGADISNTILI